MADNIQRHQLTADERRRVRTLYNDANWSIRAIARETGYGRHQVRYAITCDSIEPAFLSHGAKSHMSEEDQQLIIEYVTGSKEGRQTQWSKLSSLLFHD
jgi:hypothetical protein